MNKKNRQSDNFQMHGLTSRDRFFTVKCLTSNAQKPYSSSFVNDHRTSN